jgi:2-oxoisovalerate dehydrogenase E1 component
VPCSYQTPGANIAANLASFKNLRVFDGDGTEPQAAADLIARAVATVREWNGPALIRLVVPRLSGHSGQDTQTYKPPGMIEAEKARDPITKLKAFLVPERITANSWAELQRRAQVEVDEALARVRQHPAPEGRSVTRNIFSETDANGRLILSAREA